MKETGAPLTALAPIHAPDDFPKTGATQMRPLDTPPLMYLRLNVLLKHARRNEVFPAMDAKHKHAP
jgi:hypothetical protein